MNYKKNFFLLIVLLPFLSCQKKESKLISNSTFSKKETKEILELLRKFDDKICHIEKKRDSDISDCYQSFFERILKETASGDYKIGINEATQKEIIETLNPDLRKEFWTEGRNILFRKIPLSNSMERFPDTFQIIRINQGKYFNLLENEISIISAKTKYYFEMYSSVMDLSPAVFADVIKNYSDYNIQDDRIRLLIAIHYLTLNDLNLKTKASYEKLNKTLEIELKKKKKE